MRALLLILLLLAVLLAGTFGTETRLLLFWPAAVLVGLTGLLAAARGKMRVSSPPSDACLAACLATGLYFGLRAACSPIAAFAREDWILIASGFVTYVLTLTWGSNSRWRLTFVIALMLLAVANLTIGGIHFSGDWSFHVLPSFARSFEGERIGGFYNNPNHLAAFLSIIVFLAGAWACLGRCGATTRLLLGFLATASMLGMALTVSRGALLGLTTGSLCFALSTTWLLWNTHRHLLARIIPGFLIVTTLATAVLWKVNEDYLRRRIASQDATDDVRLPIWKAALAQHQHQPWTGQGARMFYDGGVRYRQPDLPGWVGEPDFAHSEYLQAMADYGWIGLALLLTFLLVHLGHGLRFLHWTARERFSLTGALLSNRLALVIGSLSAVIASATHALVEFHWHVGSLVICGGLLFGILANPGFKDIAPRRLPVVRPLVKLALPAAAALILWSAWTCGRADYHASRSATLALQNDLPAAEIEAVKAAALDPNNPVRQQTLGDLCLDLLPLEPTAAARKTRIDEASRRFQQACRLNPFNYLHATALADVLQVQRDFTSAEREIHRAIVLAPLYEEPRLSLALLHHRQGRFDEAERAYLWAAEAPVDNGPGVLDWSAGYRQLLQDAQRRGAATPAPSPNSP